MITEIFHKLDGFNASTAKMNHYILSALLQDTTRRPSFAQLLGYREQHAEHEHEDTVLSQQSKKIRKQLMQFLHQHQIALNPMLISDAQWDADELHHLLTLFKSILLLQVYQESECPHCCTTVLAAKQKTIDDEMNRQTMKKAMPVAPALPDGNCFMNATLLSIIHGILSYQIQEGSESSYAIKQRFIKPLFQSVPELNFDSKLTLIQNIKQLLSYFSSSEVSSEALLETLITGCDWQQLQFVCSQQLRPIMTASLQNSTAARELAAELCLNEVIAYICVTQADRLQLDSETVALMKSQIAGGEYGRMAATPAWFKLIATQVENSSTLDEIRRAITPAFNKWWLRKGFTDYCTRHQKNGTYFSTPQAMVLASALKINMKQVNRSTGAIVDYVTVSPKACNIFIEHRLDHFNARLGRPGVTGHDVIAQQMCDAIHHQLQYGITRAPIRPAPKYHPRTRKNNTPVEEFPPSMNKPELLCSIHKAKQAAFKLTTMDRASQQITSALENNYASFFASTKTQINAMKCDGNLVGARQVSEDAKLAVILQNDELISFANSFSK